MPTFPDSAEPYTVKLALGDSDAEILAKVRAARNLALVDLRLAQGLAQDVVSGIISRRRAASLMGAVS